MTKTTSVDDYKLVSSFENLRSTLLEDRYSGRLDKPLAFWALPSDRRLPLAFLGWSLRDLLDRPFEDLLATRGVGKKKISSLIKLLARATQDSPPEVAMQEQTASAERRPLGDVSAAAASSSKFDPAAISEAMWAKWRQTVVRYGLSEEKLGRLTPSLRDLPTVIWHTPLSFYVDLDLAVIRRLKTHGEKRVRVVLEVFSIVHEALTGFSLHERLDVVLQPKFVRPIEYWIKAALAESSSPTAAELRESLAAPLLEQLEIDAGPTVAKLARDRLGIEGPPLSVRQQSKQMNVTRARVYQLLDECGKVMSVRWPEGEWLLAALGEKLHTAGADAEDLQQFGAIADLFYPNHSEIARVVANFRSEEHSPLMTQ